VNYILSKLKVKKLSAVLFFILLCTSEISAGGISDYFPLRSGNVWSYNWIYSGFPSDGGVMNIYVTRDSVINSKRYYQCNFIGLSQLLRIDSLNGNIYEYSTGSGCSYNPGEKLVDSLASRKFDSTNYCGNVRRLCSDTGYVSLFGVNYPDKNFNPVFVLTAESRYYAKGIGLYYMSLGDPFPTNYTLRGCVLNGILYGDTTLTVIQQSGSIFPTGFFLRQNYPNPFNPVANLEFGILNLGFVSLKVFDVLGKEVKTLVNEIKPAGNYTAQFDGSDLPGGIYFYKLEAGEYSETKRMILLK